MIANGFNWVALPRAAWVFTNPLSFFLAVIRRRAQEDLTVRTPIGRVTLSLRNFESVRTSLPAVVKLDVEGMEVPLVENVDFEQHRNVRRLICDSTDCARRVKRAHRLEVRNGYVEDLEFID